METRQAYTGGNDLLDALPAADRKALFAHLSVVVDVEPGVLLVRDQPIDAVHFPIDAVYSIVVELAQGATYEVDTLGRSGIVGAEVVTGTHVAARTVLCQIGGRVASMPLDRFRGEMDRRPSVCAAVRGSLRRQWFVSQQTVACNFVHSDVQRCARWVLMTQDQIGREQFPLRAEYLSIMLGLATAAVHEPARVLEALGCIRYEDGFMTVTSRESLREYACECYMAQQIAAFVGLPPAE